MTKTKARFRKSTRSADSSTGYDHRAVVNEGEELKMVPR